jgi:hypothetical protein
MSASLAATHGYAFSLRIAAGLMALGGIAALVLLEHVSTQARNPLMESSPDPVPSPAPSLVGTSAG